MLRPSAVVVILFAAVATSGAAQESTRSHATEDAVYSALFALIQPPKSSAHIVLSAKTLNTGCGDSSENPIRINNCGIFAQSTPPESVVRELVATGHFDRSAWTNFLKVNQTSRMLNPVESARWPFPVIDIEQAGALDSKPKMDGLLLVSSVGLSKDGHFAVVYSVFLSYVKDVSTSANFFMLAQNTTGAWEPVGRIESMRMVQ